MLRIHDSIECAIVLYVETAASLQRPSFVQNHDICHNFP
jgi:hypothetical protein